MQITIINQKILKSKKIYRSCGGFCAFIPASPLAILYPAETPATPLAIMDNN